MGTSALDHAEKADTALTAKNFDDALAHAQQAVRLAPQSVRTQSIVADVLAARGRNAQARAHYAAALANSRTIEPALQADGIPALEQKLKSLPASP